jgi:hypothetical protein
MSNLCCVLNPYKCNACNTFLTLNGKIQEGSLCSAHYVPVQGTMCEQHYYKSLRRAFRRSKK